MAADEEWTIYETPFFCDEVSNYLTDFELDALRHQLVRFRLPAPIYRDWPR